MNTATHHQGSRFGLSIKSVILSAAIAFFGFAHVESAQAEAVEPVTVVLCVIGLIGLASCHAIDPDVALDIDAGEAISKEHERGVEIIIDDSLARNDRLSGDVADLLGN